MLFARELPPPYAKQKASGYHVKGAVPPVITGRYRVEELLDGGACPWNRHEQSSCRIPRAPACTVSLCAPVNILRALRRLIHTKASGRVLDQENCADYNKSWFGISRGNGYMGRHEKLLQIILSGRQDASVNFSEVVSLLQSLGFSMRVNGSHHLFFREGIIEIINIQPLGSKAKPYQIKQIRNIVLKYKLGAENE